MADHLPLWLDRPRSTHPPLGKAGAYDVVVVGGGLTGLLTGLLLARSGLVVTVLEGGRVGDGTTGHTTGKVSLLQGTKLSRVLRTNPPSVLREYVEANREGQAWLRRFCEDHAVACPTRPAYTYAQGRAGELRLRAEHAACRVAGLEVRWSDTPELPFDTRAALRLDDQLQVHAGELMEALVAELLNEGGALHERSRVTAVRRSGGGAELVVAVPDGDTVVTAPRVVLATGYPTMDTGGHFARLKQQRSYAAALRCRHPPQGMYLSADSPTRSIRSAEHAGEQLLLVGGHGHITGRGGRTGPRLDSLLDWATSAFEGSTVTHTWSAQDPSSVTALPYVGPLLPRDDTVLIATGFDKWGFAVAPAAALTISETILGERPSWGRALASWTPREVAAVHRALLFNAGVGLEAGEGLGRLLIGAARSSSAAGTVRLEGSRTVAESFVEGVPHRVSAVCSHLGGIVRWNEADQSWDCPWHGSRFAPDGSVLNAPAVCGLRRR